MARRVTRQEEKERAPEALFKAGESISTDIVVYLSGEDQVSKASPSLGLNKVIGISSSSGNVNDSIYVTVSGLHKLDSALAGGSPGDPVYFDDNGALTLTAPTNSEDYIQQVGLYSTATSIFVQILPALDF